MLVDSVEFVIVGGLRQDYFITPAGEAHLAHLGQLGGNLLYSAVGARPWSENVGLVARVGSNFPAGWLDIIAGRGIDAGGVVVQPGPLDTRTFYAYRTLEQRDDIEPTAHFAGWGSRCRRRSKAMPPPPKGRMTPSDLARWRCGRRS